MNSPPVLKISDEVTSSSTATGETCEPAGTYETATPPSPATAVTLSAGWSRSVGIARSLTGNRGSTTVHSPLPYGRVRTSRKWPLGSSK